MNIVETLIKLIINNAFIFVIIGGIIFNVVQRFMAQSKEEEQQRSKRAPMPPVNNPSRRERPRYRPVKEEPKTARMEPETVPSAETNPLQEKLEELKNRPYHEPSIQKKITGEKNVFKPISRKEAVQGVVWSEILGPPKSKQRKYKR
ncbi:hypothetical protein [Priestia megaterium]|uniref:hypothetical protein n=1 Tax=Priestia megaterium TaxID=1404 RepID=UPI00189E06B8|nr:hypothetical protein [Priestia megaterium]